MSIPTSESIYLPLDPKKSQIRLIHLQPRPGSNSDSDSDNDTITCSLQVAGLDDETCVYDALSYEWGIGTDTSFAIILNGVEISVRENLWRAMRTLSNDQNAQPIWIDALCINQEDSIERSSQVSQMGRIYQRASCVVAWLGAEEDADTGAVTATQQAIQLVELLYGSSKSTRYYYRPEAAYWRPYQYAHSARTPGGNNVPVTYRAIGWAGLLTLCQKSYWTRLWILQELVLAARIVIRTYRSQLHWVSLEHIHDQITNAKQVSGNNQRLNYYAQVTRSEKMVIELSSTVPFKILQQRDARRTFGYQSYTLFELVQMHKSAQCADTQDKVFGLIGLCSQCCCDNVVVDYQKSPMITCQMLLEHYLSRHSIHGLNLKNGSNLELFTLVKELVVTFRRGDAEQLSVTTDPYPEVFEEPQSDSVSMVACSPRRSISLDSLEPCFARSMSFYSRYHRIQFRFWHPNPTDPIDNAHKYWICKINHAHFLVLRESEGHLLLVGTAQDRAALDHVVFPHDEVSDGIELEPLGQVPFEEETSSKSCLYLNSTVLKDVCLLLDEFLDAKFAFLLLSWNCLSCDYCWNKRHVFDLKSKRSSYPTLDRLYRNSRGGLIE